MVRIHRYALPNQGVLKNYDGYKYKLTAHKWLHTPGMEVERLYREKGSVNDDKLDCNLSRARSRVFELAICNPWEYWVTLTINRRKHDRTDLKAYREKFARFIREERCRGLDLEYLMLPDRHVKPGWHFHGFLTGLHEGELRHFTERERLNPSIAKMLAAGRDVRTWTKYHDKFGFAVVERVTSKEALAKYALKYINPKMQRRVVGLGEHLFYRSKGLLGATELKRGTIVRQMAPQFENEYVRVQWIDGKSNIDEVVAHFFGTSI